MKICLVGLELIPTASGIFVGGIANNAIRLSKGLTRRGHEVHIITSDVSHTLKTDLAMSSAIIHPVLVSARYASALYGLETTIKLSRRVLKQHSKEKFDILNIHSGYSALSIIAHILSLLTRVPTVFTLYSAVQELVYFNELYRQLSTLAESGFMLSKIDKIIAVSENVKRALEDKGVPHEKIICIPPAVDAEAFNPDVCGWRARQRLGIDSDIPLILYMGNWNPWKGADVLIESMKNIIRKFPDAKFVLAWGELINWRDRRRKMLSEKVSNLGLKSNIIELGIVDNVGELMAASDIVVVPFIDTYGVADRPLTILEAMACGRAVIATKVGGIPEIIQNGVNGILVNPGKPSEIEEAVCCLLENKKMVDKIGMNAARYVSSNYTINRIVLRLEKVYEELLAT